MFIRQVQAARCGARRGPWVQGKLDRGDAGL